MWLDVSLIALSPVVFALPWLGYESFLQFSFILFTCSVLHALIRFVFRVDISWLWMVAAIITFGTIGSSLPIVWFSTIYATIIRVCSPITLLLEGLLTVFCIQGIGQYLMFRISHYPRSSSMVKSIILGGALAAVLSLLAYSYAMFSDPSTSSNVSAAYASFLTVYSILAVANVVNENAIISDIALLAGYFLFNMYLIGYHSESAPSYSWFSVLKYWIQPVGEFADWLAAMQSIASLASLIVVVYRLTIFAVSIIFVQSLRGADPFAVPSVAANEELNVGTLVKLCYRPLLIFTLTQSIQAQRDPLSQLNEVQWRWANIFLAMAWYCLVLYTTGDDDHEEWTRHWTTATTS